MTAFQCRMANFFSFFLSDVAGPRSDTPTVWSTLEELTQLVPGQDNLGSSPSSNLSPHMPILHRLRSVAA